MKKRYFVFIFNVFCCIAVFGDLGMQEEVDFLLFSPNSGNRFENEEKAFIQLDNLAQYLLGKNLNPGQILVYGYAAYAPNEIKSDDLSRERALTVMNELQKRSISKELFSDPVGYGAVYLWGNNDTENTRKLNRRVRVLLLNETSMSVTREIISAETKNIIPDVFYAPPAGPEIAGYYMPKKASFKFPWWILAPLAFTLLAAFILFLLSGRRSQKTVTAADAQTQISETVNVPEYETAKSMTTYTVNLDEEIRTRAYELSRQRGGQDDYREQDWFNAVREISSWYIACGHSVYTDGGYWWASNTVDTSPTAV
jgi:hypothetical protein